MAMPPKISIGQLRKFVALVLEVHHSLAGPGRNTASSHHRNQPCSWLYSHFAMTWHFSNIHPDGSKDKFPSFEHFPRLILQWCFRYHWTAVEDVLPRPALVAAGIAALRQSDMDCSSP